MKAVSETIPATHDLRSPRDRQAAIQRAMQLIESRQIARHLQQIALDRATHAWLSDRLLNIQLAVYTLDHYGETCWNIDSERLEQLWEAIRREIRLVGIGAKQVDLLLEQMKTYQKIEISLREGDDVLCMPLACFYELKTCDVRMARRIVDLVTSGWARAEPVWDCFDIVSEVCDDLEDVKEDLGTFNGNRFLLQRLATGQETTTAIYVDFLRGISAEIDCLAQEFGVDHPVLKMSARRVCRAHSVILRNGGGPALYPQGYVTQGTVVPSAPTLRLLKDGIPPLVSRLALSPDS